VARIGGLQTEPQFLIDTDAINQKYAARADNPYRWWTGTFHAPREMSGEILRRKTYESCHRFIEAMAKRNWVLTGKLRVSPPQTARDISTNVTLLDKYEYRVRGIFKLDESPKTIRTEIPSGLVLRNPEQRLTTSEAHAALRS
jgi:3-methyladenine DNA glycosylase/8-oxoguanine DNA glycosylase